MEETKEPNKNMIWSLARYHFAVAWWRRNGSFNTELYNKIVEIKHQINLK